MLGEVPPGMTAQSRRSDDNRPGAGGVLISTLLKLALLNGVQETVRRYIDHGGNVNAMDVSGQTSLMLAASRGHLEICRLLVKAGADISVRDRHGRNALSIASMHGYTDVVDFLGNNPDRTAGNSVPENGSDPSGFGQDSISGFSDEICSWEEESNSVPASDYLNALAAARSVHNLISAHSPLTADSDWSDISVELPFVRRSRWKCATENDEDNQSAGYRDRLAAEKIWEAADQITLSSGIPATLFQLMGHPATRRMIYKHVKAEFARWRSFCEVHGYVSHREEIIQASPIDNKDESAKKEQVKHTEDKPLHNSPDAGIKEVLISSVVGNPCGISSGTGRPPAKSMAGRIWAAADEITSLKGVPANVSDLMAHAVSRGMSYPSIKEQFLRWRSFYDFCHRKPSDNGSPV